MRWGRCEGGANAKAFQCIRERVAGASPTIHRGVLSLVQCGMREIAADWVTFHNRPSATAFFQSIGQLHGPRPAFNAKFHLRLSVIALNRHLFDVRVEGLQVEISLIRQRFTKLPPIWRFGL